ncbi:hypothetical protein Cgig2_031129 [Carnegiea gigantea]|uniref:Uncharacterized protein n=1 Tax=Carnegiea gigantea TaxID=171969 RepID=A0A9Q1JF87_9CARY|nr:hypothetical protein Cgig2_031129 [Carnegiea gigantea]
MKLLAILIEIPLNSCLRLNSLVSMDQILEIGLRSVLDILQCKTPESQCLDVTSIHFMGQDETWFANHISVKKNVNWSDFITDVCNRFKEESGTYDDEDVVNFESESTEPEGKSLGCTPCNLSKFVTVVPSARTAGMEGVDPIEIIDRTQCVKDIMDDLVSEEKQNERSSSNFIDKRLDDLDKNNMKKLIFKTPMECEVFYFTYAKVVGFGLEERNHELIIMA